MLRYPVPNLDFFDQISFLLVIVSLFSSVVEHWSRKPGVVSSILTGGIIINIFYRRKTHMSSLTLKLRVTFKKEKNLRIFFHLNLIE